MGTITTWIVLELLTYPKEVPITSGFSAVIKGFFSASVGAYPAWVMLLLAVILLAPTVILLGLFIAYPFPRASPRGAVYAAVTRRVGSGSEGRRRLRLRPAAAVPPSRCRFAPPPGAR